MLETPMLEFYHETLKATYEGSAKLVPLQVCRSPPTVASALTSIAAPRQARRAGTVRCPCAVSDHAHAASHSVVSFLLSERASYMTGGCFLPHTGWLIPRRCPNLCGRRPLDIRVAQVQYGE
jgi:hypothetical protein